MAGKKFLNPVVKVGLCAVGMLIMGYFLVSSVSSGSFGDRTDIARLIVFVGFAYLFIRSIADVVAQRKVRSAPSREMDCD
jgi:hypothetical protein